MHNECQAPLVPDEVDLTDFKFMPLEVARLLQSEWWIVACNEDPRRAVAAVNLWARSWHQRPAASVPDNDIVLASMAMVPLGVWREIRDAVMDAWVKCSDGRWYHPVVAEKALESWGEKRGYRKRVDNFTEHQRARARKGWETKKKNAGALPGHNSGNAPAMPNECPDNANERDRDRDRDRDLKSANALSVDASAPKPSVRPSVKGYTEEFERWWAVYPKRESKGAAFSAFQRAKTRTTVQVLMDAAAAYAKRRAADERGHLYTKMPTTWLNQNCWDDEATAPPKGSKPKLFPGYVPMAGPAGG